MQQFGEACFSWPTLPATLLLLCICVYWLLMLFGAVDLDFLDLDIDLDMDADIDIGADPSILQLGFVPLRFLNLGSVPTMLWGSVFAFCAWIISLVWNSPLPHPDFRWTADLMAITRDFGVAAMLTKMMTQPLRGRFDPVEPNQVDKLMGRECIITTSVVNETFGEAELPTDGSPLKLKVRSRISGLSKGTVAIIVDHDAETNEFYIESA